MWAIVNSDPEWPKEPRHFVLFATGEGLGENAVALPFIGTFQITNKKSGRNEVYHLFEDTMKQSVAQ